MMTSLRSRPAWTTGLLLACAFVLSHPYVGIRHDGILYLGEALLDLDPARMSHDLFFVFGSQASFTIIPRLYALAIDWLGIGDAARALLAVSLTLYFVAACWLTAKLAPGKIFIWSALSVFVGAHVYGGDRVFAYGETFFTARSLAEPMILVGIGLLWRGRPALAVACMAAAAFVHPLIALPGLLLTWCWLVARNRRWLWSATVVLVPMALGLAGTAPFTGLFQRYDAEWFTVIEKATPFVFPLNWALGDWGTVAFDVAILGWVVAIDRARPSPTATIARAAVLSGLLGIGASLVGADLLHNVLLTGLQIWRSHWLMHWIAMALAPVLFAHLWALRSNNARAAALCIVASFFCLTSFGPMLIMPGAMLLVRFERRAPIGIVVVRAFGALCVGLMLVLLLRQAGALTAFIGLLGGTVPVQISRVMSITLVILGSVAVGLRYLPRGPLAALAIPAAVLGVAVLGWDQREAWTRFQEGYTTSHALLWSDTVRAEDRVYWYREIRAPWLLMHHANYFSPNQGSGVLFNRRTAVEIDARSKSTSVLEFQETVCQAMNNLNKKETSCEPDVEVVEDICSSADLSFIVLQSVLAIKPAAVFDTGFVEHDFKKTFYLYRCRDMKTS